MALAGVATADPVTAIRRSLAALRTACAANVLGVQRARDAQSDAKSRSGGLGCSEDVKVVDRKLAATQAAREARHTVVSERPEHVIG